MPHPLPRTPATQLSRPRPRNCPLPSSGVSARHGPTSPLPGSLKSARCPKRSSQFHKLDGSSYVTDVRVAVGRFLVPGKVGRLEVRHRGDPAIAPDLVNLLSGKNLWWASPLAADAPGGRDACHLHWLARNLGEESLPTMSSLFHCDLPTGVLAAQAIEMDPVTPQRRTGRCHRAVPTPHRSWGWRRPHRPRRFLRPSFSTDSTS